MIINSTAVCSKLAGGARPSRRAAADPHKWLSPTGPGQLLTGSRAVKVVEIGAVLTMRRRHAVRGARVCAVEAKSIFGGTNVRIKQRLA